MAISQAKLIQAARRVFAQDGYKAASIVEIAQVAGIAVGGVYLLYPSKLELFLAVYRAEDEKTKNRIVGRIDWSQPRAAFAAYLRATTQATRRNKILAEWQSDVPGELTMMMRSKQERAVAWQCVVSSSSSRCSSGAAMADCGQAQPTRQSASSLRQWQRLTRWRVSPQRRCGLWLMQCLSSCL